MQDTNLTKYMRRPFAWKTSGKALVHAGNAARDAHAWEEATTHYQAFLKVNPEHAAIWVQLGNCAKEAKKFALALDSYDSAIALNQHDADVFLQKGHLLKVMGRTSEAAACYRKSLALSPADNPASAELAALTALPENRPAGEPQLPDAGNRNASLAKAPDKANPPTDEVAPPDAPGASASPAPASEKTHPRPNDMTVDEPTAAADVPAIYMILLGRRPESRSVIAECAGQSLGSTLWNILHSQEFVFLADNAVKSGVLPHTHSLYAEDFREAAGFLSRIAVIPQPDVESWWLTIHLMLNLPIVAPFAQTASNRDFIELAAEQAARDAGSFISILPFFVFDSAWLIRANRRVRLAYTSGIYRDAGAFFLTSELARNEQFLPAFSHNLESSYRTLLDRDAVAIPDVLTQILKGVRAGAVTHWLFSTFSYRHILAWQDDLPKDATRQLNNDSDLYLDFLKYGDARDYSPHPLFSHHVYKTLNPQLDFTHGTTFKDYILDGCFSGAVTSLIFDASFYLASNPSAQQAILNGTHVNALHHFLTIGIFRDLPFSPDLDLGHYLAVNPDIGTGIASGSIPSATWHFVYCGLVEGRAPNPYFNPSYYRERHPHVKQEMRNLGISSELEHYLLVGKSRGYKPDRPLVAERPAMDAAKATFLRRVRRSYANIRRRPLDFSSVSGSDETLSVILPVCNEVEFTCRFIECAYFAAHYLFHSTGVGCEIVVVSNGSSDDTAPLLTACGGLKVISLPDPIGFPRAVNLGVRHSTGSVLTVVNNDIEFMPDTLAKIWQRLKGDISIGVLGGITILPNETLQEAGSFLDVNGSVVGLGRFENPWDQYFYGVNSADYCTGSFISFRREDYDAVGGLDEAFSPGYYEETDFTLRIADKLGKRAAVDSDIQITHFEHASFGKGRPPTTAYASIKRNQQLFASKHREALALRPTPMRLVTDQGARPQVIGRMRFLVIEDLMPDTRLGSGFVRSSHILASLTKHGVAYDLLVLSASPVLDDFSDPLVTVYRGWLPGQEAETILNRHAARYSHVLVCRTHNLTRFANQLERLRDQHGFSVICDTEALSVLRVLELRSLVGDSVSESDRTAAIRLDLNSEVKVSQWIAVSPYERQQIEAAGFGPVSVICHHFPEQSRAHLRGWRDRNRVIVVGSMHEPGSPNHDGLLWFMKRIYPRCRAIFDELRLTVVGFWHPDVQSEFKAAYGALGIDFAGVVTDARLNELYGESRIALAPTRFAAGVASKILEAMTLSVPVVMTDLLHTQMTGTPHAGQSGLAVGARDDDGASFAQWCIRLATDEETWNRVRLKQYEAVKPLGGVEAFESGMMAVLANARDGNHSPHFSQ